MDQIKEHSVLDKLAARDAARLADQHKRSQERQYRPPCALLCRPFAASLQSVACSYLFYSSVLPCVQACIGSRRVRCRILDILEGPTRCPRGQPGRLRARVRVLSCYWTMPEAGTASLLRIKGLSRGLLRLQAEQQRYTLRPADSQL